MRKLFNLTTIVTTLLAAAACQDSPAMTSPETTDALRPSASVGADQAGCHQVHGSFHEEGLPNALEGELTGDLVGTTSGRLTNFVKEGDPLHSAGHNFGVRTYSITGGTVPEFVDERFSAEFVGINTGDEASLLFDLQERVKAVSGVRKASLTGHGTLDARGFPYVIIDMEYRGVVCP